MSNAKRVLKELVKKSADKILRFYKTFGQERTHEEFGVWVYEDRNCYENPFLTSSWEWADIVHIDREQEYTDFTKWGGGVEYCTTNYTAIAV